MRSIMISKLLVKFNQVAFALADTFAVRVMFPVYFPAIVAVLG